MVKLLLVGGLMVNDGYRINLYGSCMLAWVVACSCAHSNKSGDIVIMFGMFGDNTGF